MSQQQQAGATTRMIPLSKWDTFHPWPTPQAMRNRKHAAENGKDPDFLKCIVTVGGRVLVDEEKFFEWVDSHKRDNEGT